MHQTTEQLDLNFLAELQRIQPATVQQLCVTTGVTATAVRQRLTRLEARGFVAREAVRHGRGRPFHGYTLTPSGLRQLGDDYADLALLLWRELNEIEDAAVRSKLLRRVQQALVERFGSRVTGNSVASRIEALSEALADRGLMVELVHSPTDLGQLPILREHSCPYHELAEEDSRICDLEQAVFSELVGAPVELSSCRLDGHRCCEFQVGKREKSDPAMVVNEVALPV